jgi:hypothetical protein
MLNPEIGAFFIHLEFHTWLCLDTTPSRLWLFRFPLQIFRDKPGKGEPTGGAKASSSFAQAHHTTR